MNRYIFTFTAGRSGQNTLTKILETSVENSYIAFEQPQINYFFKGRISNIERKFRRKFLETHELLGRGKILESFQDGNIKYIEFIANKRLNEINKKMINNKQVYIDVSKYFGRGLHVGFQNILPKFSLIHLVRDPILNMKSFLNRNKNFYLDNNPPDAKINKLVMSSQNMSIPELYLWSWCEMSLRYEDMKSSRRVDRYVEIHTSKLNDNQYINKCLKKLDIRHSKVMKKNIKLNTNKEMGYKSTVISKFDVDIFDKFINNVPNEIIRKIPYLINYDPYSVHNIKQ